MSFRTFIALAACALSGQPALAQSSSPDTLPPATTASIHYKGVTITPVGYFAAEAVYRSRNETADIGSSFNAIPFDGTSNYQMSEFRGSARQSRLGLMVDGKSGSTKFTGYFEGDFLGAGVTSNSNESNSYVLRVRQFWGQAAMAGGWTLTAGQMWSLLTTDKKGIAPRQELTPQTIDAQYAVGFDWARQFALRLTKRMGHTAWFALSAEEPQMTFSAHNVPSNVLIGNAGGPLLNSTTNYSADVAPDVIAKLAFEPGWGHYELKALGRLFRDRVIDTGAMAVDSHNIQREGYGLGAAAIWPFKVNHRDVFDLSASGLWGQGIGRYGTSQLPDATINGEGAIVPIRAAHGLLGLEAHPSHRLDLYGYAGAEYAYRTADTNAVAGKAVGYGSPDLNNAGCDVEALPTNDYTPAAGASGTCNADTRVLYQGNLGFWYRFYQGSAGTMAWGLQYSYTSRNTWSGLNGVQPNAIDNMGFLSIRYYFP